MKRRYLHLKALALCASFAALSWGAISAQPAQPPSKNYPSYPGNPVRWEATSKTQEDATPNTSSRTEADAETKTSAPASHAGEASPAGTVSTAETLAGDTALFNSNLYRVEKSLLSSTQVGEEYQYRLRITALEDITNIRVTETLPPNLDFVAAGPAANVSGNRLTWGWDSQNKGEVRDILVTVRPTVEGKYITYSRVCVDPMLQLPLVAGLPRLAIAKEGPAEAEIEDTINYTITVRNEGTAVARNVQVVDVLPQGLVAKSDLNASLGDLQPGETKTVNVVAQASDKGSFTNVARATFKGGAPVEAKSIVAIVGSRLTVTKEGPANQFIFGNVTYRIVARNDGNTVLNDVVVTDDIPAGTKVVAAPGAQLGGSKATWTVPALAPGQSSTHEITLTADEPVSVTNVATATATAATGRALKQTATAATIWEGAPGVLTELVDTEDPLRVGGSTVYELRITNQATHRPINAQVKLILSEHVRPTGITGDVKGQIIGQEVVFEEVVLNPRTTIVLRVPAEAVKSGVAKARLEFMSSFLPEPFVKEESTFVY